MPRIQGGRRRRKSQEAVAAEVEARYDKIKLKPRPRFCPANRYLTARRFLVHCSIDAEITEWHPDAFDDCNWSEREAVRLQTEEAVAALKFSGPETYTFVGSRTFFLDLDSAVYAAQRVFVELLAMLLKGDDDTRLAEYCEEDIDEMLRVPEIDDEAASKRAADAEGDEKGRPPTDVVVLRSDVPLEVDALGCDCPNQCLCRLRVSVKSFTLASEEGLGDRVQCIECGAFAPNKETARKEEGWLDDDEGVILACADCAARVDARVGDVSNFTVSSINEFGCREYTSSRK